MNALDIKKQANRIIKNAHKKSKLEYCLCCKKHVSSFCNSHSLPKFILKNISNGGFVLTSNNYFKNPLMENSKGINKSGVFKRICNDCDNMLFKTYESYEQLLLKPRKKMMAQIDLKNTLRMYDKRLTEIEIYNELLNMNSDSFTIQASIETQIINYLDLEEIKTELNRDLKILSKESSSSFDLIFWEKLDYITPIAFQGHMALVGDLKGNIINDIYNKSEKNIIENINVCVFPLQSQTVVLMFVSSENKKYKNFIKQFKQLNKDRKLQLISFMIFNYSEDFFISYLANKKIINNEYLDSITQNTSNIYALDEDMANEIKKYKINELCEYIKFPNLLDNKFSLSNLSNYDNNSLNKKISI